MRFEMGGDQFDLAGLASYLQRDARDLEKLASRGRIPGRRVGGDWRFHRAEVHDWLECEMPGLSDRQLEAVEVGMLGGPSQSGPLQLLVSELLTQDRVAASLDARTAPGVLQKLVEIANASWQVYSPDVVLAAVREREEQSTTSVGGGVAIPHPGKPLPDAFGESLIAFGRTATGIPFGGPRGELTDLFFLVLCHDPQLHVQVLARLARMFQRPDFTSKLREAADAAAAFQLIQATEIAVLA